MSREKTKKEQEEFHCFECNKIVKPTILGRARFICPNCKSDMTLDTILQYELMEQILPPSTPLEIL